MKTITGYTERDVLLMRRRLYRRKQIEELAAILSMIIVISLVWSSAAFQAMWAAVRSWF